MVRRIEVSDEDRPFFSALQRVRGRQGATVQNLNALGDEIQCLYASFCVRDEIVHGTPTPELALRKVLTEYGAMLEGREALLFQAIFNLNGFGDGSQFKSLERRLDALGPEFGQSETRRNDADRLTRAVANAFRVMQFSPGRSRSKSTNLDEDGSRSGWDLLTSAILEATTVRIVGVAPLSLIDKLQTRWLAATRTPHVSYYTCPPESLMSGQTAGASMTLQLWNAALIGLRNLLRDDNADDAVQRYHHFAHTIDQEPGQTCVVVCEGDRPSTTIVTSLPSTTGTTRPRHVVSRPIGSENELSEFIEELVGAAAPLIIRQVECASDPAPHPRHDDFPSFPVTRLSPYGTTERHNPQVTQPIAVTVLRAGLPDGSYEIILKRRSAYTDTSDFGIYSLLSARIQEGDLAKGLGVDIQPGHDADDTLQRMWIRAGSPSPFRVPIEACVAAAQRDVFTTAGLQIATERFEFIGSHFGEVGEIGLRLGFVAFLVDLVRSAGDDELVTAIDNGRDYLRRIRPAELHDDKLPVNRVLRAMPAWLAGCLGQDSESSV